MKANELKVGDKFTWDGFPQFGVFTVVKGVTETDFCGGVTATSDEYGEGIFESEKVTLVSEKPKLEVGKTYTSNNGYKWECILVEGDLAWLRGGPDHSAYVWNVDGTPVCLRSSKQEYTIEFICEGVDVFSSRDVYVGNDKVQLNGTVTTKGGVPDWTTYKET